MTDQVDLPLLSFQLLDQFIHLDRQIRSQVQQFQSFKERTEIYLEKWAQLLHGSLPESTLTNWEERLVCFDKLLLQHLLQPTSTKKTNKREMLPTVQRPAKLHVAYRNLLNRKLETPKKNELMEMKTPKDEKLVRTPSLLSSPINLMTPLKHEMQQEKIQQNQQIQQIQTPNVLSDDSDCTRLACSEKHLTDNESDPDLTQWQPEIIEKKSPLKHGYDCACCKQMIHATGMPLQTRHLKKLQKLNIDHLPETPDDFWRVDFSTQHFPVRDAKK